MSSMKDVINKYRNPNKREAASFNPSGMEEGVINSIIHTMEESVYNSRGDFLLYTKNGDEFSVTKIEPTRDGMIFTLQGYDWEKKEEYEVKLHAKLQVDLKVK